LSAPVAVAVLVWLAAAAPARASVYWANSGGGSGTTIGRANADGSGTRQDFIAGASGPEGVAVDGAHVYWANGGTHSIGRANLDGSSPEPSFVTGASDPFGVAVDGAHVYWTSTTPRSDRASCSSTTRASISPIRPSRSWSRASALDGTRSH
jgi:low-density lipoprotein receptor class B